MPELPEVEFARRLLERHLKGARIEEVVVHDARVVSGGAAAFSRALRGRTVTSIERRGKRLAIELDDGTFVLSRLGMTGKWLALPDSAEEARFEKVRLVVLQRASRGRSRERARRAVVYTDPRILGRLRTTRDEKVAFHGLGPDPLVDGIDARALRERLGKRAKLSIKEALLDQALLAGVGNIHAQEALFRARVDPRRRASTLSAREVASLVRGIDGTFRDALADLKGKTSITYVEEPRAENPFRVYGKGGEPCPRCTTKLTRVVQGGRSTVFCSRCQR